jgi:putative addiction module component (TIGR02574 family)
LTSDSHINVLRLTRGGREPYLSARSFHVRRRCSRLIGGQLDAYNRVMTKAAEAVLAEALRLDVKARAQLAAELLASLDGPTDPDAEEAWASEIDRRVKALEAGTEPLESWHDVKRRIEKDILGR